MLFDISSCSCKLPIVPCNDKAVKCKSEDCNQNHILCLCKAEKKVIFKSNCFFKDIEIIRRRIIYYYNYTECNKHFVQVPLEDCEYLKDQREKVGPKGSLQLGPVDKEASKKRSRVQSRVEQAKSQLEQLEQQEQEVELLGDLSFSSSSEQVVFL